MVSMTILALNMVMIAGTLVYLATIEGTWPGPYRLGQGEALAHRGCTGSGCPPWKSFGPGSDEEAMEHVMRACPL